MKLLKKRNHRSGIPAWVYILAFLFPIIIFIAGFALKGVYPFGEESALVVDGVHQYTAFYIQFAGSSADEIHVRKRSRDCCDPGQSGTLQRVHGMVFRKKISWQKQHGSFTRLYVRPV